MTNISFDEFDCVDIFCLEKYSLLIYRNQIFNLDLYHNIGTPSAEGLTYFTSCRCGKLETAVSLLDVQGTCFESKLKIILFA